jgi:predicted choloylglycine hydrolase
VLLGLGCGRGEECLPAGNETHPASVSWFMSEPLPPPRTAHPPRDFWRRQLRVTWQLPVVLAGLGAAALLDREWSWLSSRPPRVVRLSGSHHEMGLRHGRLLRAEIHELFHVYVEEGLVAHEGYSLAQLRSRALRFDPHVPRELREEMRGIAEGSGLPYDEVLLLNTIPDLTHGKSPALCSALAVRTTRDGLLVGRNLDWEDHGIAHRAGVVFVFAPASGRTVLSVGWPGMVGVATGMNDAGVVLTLNLAFAGDLVGEATPSLLRLRHALERATTVEEAARSLASEPRTLAMNILVAGGAEDRAEVLELSGRRHAVVPLAGGSVVTTNFYQSLGIAGGVGSERSAALAACLRRSGAATGTVDLRRALATVAFPAAASGPTTLQSVIFLPRRLAAEVAIGQLPASAGRWFPVALADGAPVAP